MTIVRMCILLESIYSFFKVGVHCVAQVCLKLLSSSGPLVLIFSAC